MKPKIASEISFAQRLPVLWLTKTAVGVYIDAPTDAYGNFRSVVNFPGVWLRLRSGFDAASIFRNLISLFNLKNQYANAR